MGGIVSRTNPENCFLDDSNSQDSSRFEKTANAAIREVHSLSHKLAHFPQARLRKHVLEERAIAELEVIEQKIDGSGPYYCYEPLDIEDPFKKRGLLMADFVQSGFEDIFRELFFYADYEENKCRNRLLLEAAKKEEAAKYTILQSASVNSGNNNNS